MNFRTDNNHVSETFAFQNAQLKILDVNGQDSQLGIKKGEKYQIQIDLEDSLVSNCQGKNIKIFFAHIFYRANIQYSQYSLTSKTVK